MLDSWQKKVITSNNFTYYPTIKLINKLLKDGAAVLDIGCGVGTLDFYMASRSKHIIGLDLSKMAILKANKSRDFLGLKNIKFRCQDIMSFRTNKLFDLVLCTEVLEHISNDCLLLKKVSKYLRQNGRFILTTPLDTAPLCRLGLTKNFDKRVGHLRRYSYRSLCVLISKSGLKIESVAYGEGIFRNTLFVYKVFDSIIRLGNRYKPISNLLKYIDDISLRLMGPSNIYLMISKR